MQAGAPHAGKMWASEHIQYHSAIHSYSSGNWCHKQRGGVHRCKLQFYSAGWTSEILAAGSYSPMQGREGRKHLYHMVPKVLWEHLKGNWQPYFPPTYEQVGTALRLTPDLLSIACRPGRPAVRAFKLSLL